MKKITVIAKVTSNCNLNCPYCYTRSTIKQNKPNMTIETFEKILQNIVIFYDEATIIYHGGEPLLLPYEWYEKTLDLVKKYSEKYNVKITLGLQSNLTLYDEKKIKLLDDNNVGIGFSYDGMTNNLTRKNDETIINNYVKIRSNFNNQKHLNNICLVTSNNYKDIEKDFRLFELLDLKPKFNLVFNTVTMVDELNTIDYDILIDKYAKLFKEIISSKNHYYEYLFENYVSYIYNKHIQRNGCSRGDCRKKWISVHQDGNMYPCGQEWRQKNDNYLLGNINENTFFEAFNSENFKIFSDKIQKKMDTCRVNCELYNFCNGDCPGEDFSNMGDVGIIHKEKCDYNRKLMLKFKEILDNNKIENLNYLRIINGGYNNE